MEPIYAILTTAGGAKYKLQYFKSYVLEHDIEIPADYFEVIISNMDYRASKVIAAGVKIDFYLKDEIIFHGIIDDVEFNYSVDSNDFRIIGRDKMSLLLDNDAMPATYYKMSLQEYLGKVCPKYGIEFSTNSTEKFDKIVVTPGETEYAVIERLCKDRKLVTFFDSNGVLQCKKLESSSNYAYKFGNEKSNYIKIKEANIVISADVKNEVIVYGDNYENNKNIKGQYIDSNMVIRKRRIINEPQIETTADANERAKEEFYELNKNAIIVDLLTTTKQKIEINKPALIDIPKAEFNLGLLTYKVRYTKDLDNGTLTEIQLKLMPGFGGSYKDNRLPTLPNL